MTAGGCAGHAAFADELREYATGALNLLEPLIEQVRDRQPDEGSPEPASCAACPLCAVLTVLRGGRSELAVKVAEQAVGLLAVLRVALDEGMAGASTPSPAPGSHVGPAGEANDQPPRGSADATDSRRGVQRIAVARGDGSAASVRC